MRKPKVLLDFMASKSLYNGLGQLSLHLSKALANCASQDYELEVLAPKNRHQHFDERFKFRTMSRFCRKFLSQYVLCLFSGAWKYDLWHVTNQNSIYLPLDSRTPLILTIHDLNFLRDVDDQSIIDKKLRVMQQRINRACVITTGSYFAKGEIEAYLQLNGKPVVVVYHGSLATHIVAERPELPFYSVSEQSPEFFFSIGEFLPKKNYKVLIDMMAILPDEQLFFAGNDNSTFGREMHAYVRELGLQDRIIFLGKVSNEEKRWLYEHAKGFFFPSLNEGFGLPMVEALSSGIPVFCSNATSLPEIGGGFAFEWSDFAPQEMKKVVERGLSRYAASSEFQVEAQEYGLGFSWDKAAKQYSSIYRCVLEGRLESVSQFSTKLYPKRLEFEA